VLFKVVFKKSSSFSDDSSGFLVVFHFLFEFVMGFSSISFQFVNLFLIAGDFLFLGSDNTLHHGSSGVEISFKGSF